MDGGLAREEAMREQDFATMILDNLRKAGVQNTNKAERLKFDRLDPFAGEWIQAAGEYTDAERQDAARGRLHRPGARHGRPATGQGSGQGGGPGRRLRLAGRLRLRLRSARCRKRPNATAS